ncbi:MAG: hypothetical protein V4490_03320 [Pseudomonadota bacterium]
MYSTLKRGLFGSFFCLVVLMSAATAATVVEHKMQDPTRPADFIVPNAGPAASTSKELVLTSIIRSPLRQVAIINEQSLQVGDAIGEYKVVQIVSDGVKIQSASKVFMLELNTLQIKTAK